MNPAKSPTSPTSPTSPSINPVDFSKIPERLRATLPRGTVEADLNPPDYVLFIVHGMGHQSKEAGEVRGNFHNNLRDFHELMINTLAKQDVDANIEVIPIEWHSKFHGLSHIGPRMKSITLNTVGSIRLIFNDYLSDVPYYFEPSSHITIAQIICKRINEEWQKLQQRHPGWNGKVHILGHSLGGCLCFDILTHQAACGNSETCKHNQMVQRQQERSHLESDMETSWLQWHHPNYHYPILKFKPATLFTVGSPTGAVHVQRSQDFARHLKYLQDADIRFYNIFRSLDPLGYRTEPFLDPQYANLEPVSLSQTIGVPVAHGTPLPESTFARMPSISLPPMPDLSGAKRTFSFAMEYLRGTMAEEEVENSRPSQYRKTDSVLDRMVAVAKRVVGTDPPLEEVLGETRLISDGRLANDSRVHVDLIETDDVRHLDEVLQEVVTPTTPFSQEALEPVEAPIVEPEIPQITPPKVRLDYVIYPPSSIMTSLYPEFLSGMRSHFGYWRDEDLMKHLLKVMGNN